MDAGYSASDPRHHQAKLANPNVRYRPILIIPDSQESFSGCRLLPLALELVSRGGFGQPFEAGQSCREGE